MTKTFVDTRNFLTFRHLHQSLSQQHHSYPLLHYEPKCGKNCNLLWKNVMFGLLNQPEKWIKNFKKKKFRLSNNQRINKITGFFYILVGPLKHFWKNVFFFTNGQFQFIWLPIYTKYTIVNIEIVSIFNSALRTYPSLCFIVNQPVSTEDWLVPYRAVVGSHY